MKSALQTFANLNFGRYINWHCLIGYQFQISILHWTRVSIFPDLTSIVINYWQLIMIIYRISLDNLCFFSPFVKNTFLLRYEFITSDELSFGKYCLFGKWTIFFLSRIFYIQIREYTRDFCDYTYGSEEKFILLQRKTLSFWEKKRERNHELWR